jgi:hypothetical protein
MDIIENEKECKKKNPKGASRRRATDKEEKNEIDMSSNKPTKFISLRFSLPCGPFSLIPEVTEKLLCLHDIK